ncbi:hypothetical protein EES42_41435 [Streptomyces sp. ADI95-17]|nr:hypothetical protein EES42_41435 [Streptomyces sp. ADI95-17]
MEPGNEVEVVDFAGSFAVGVVAVVEGLAVVVSLGGEGGRGVAYGAGGPADRAAVEIAVQGVVS